MNINDLNKLIRDFDDSEPVWENTQLDEFMKHHSKIEDAMIVTPKKLFPNDSVKTKYGRLKVVVNPYVPPNQIFITVFDENLMKPPSWVKETDNK